jgi:UDP-sulfoquinovose synthase
MVVAQGPERAGGQAMKIAVLGGDGFVGWPTVLQLSHAGHEVHIVDNLSRRWIDAELGVQSLTPMDSIQERCRIWKQLTGAALHFHLLDIAKEYERLKGWLATHRPDAIVHFAEQRAAPYSMISDRHKVFTVNNNVAATHNLLAAMVDTGLDAHLVHLGTMGVYGYSTIGAPIPEGYLDVSVALPDGSDKGMEILYPTRPGSIYHMTKSLDQILFQFYAQNDGLRITDLHQGIVWGTHTDQTRRHEQLINRFDYDGDYGTVLNRFLIQAAIDYPLTVHGSGGQTRAFIHLQDSVRCIELALSDPPAAGDRVKIFNQMTETHRVRDLAELVARLTGARIALLPNPRKEADANDLIVENAQFLALGLEPITLARRSAGPKSSRWRADTPIASIARGCRACRPGRGTLPVGSSPIPRAWP